MQDAKSPDPEHVASRLATHYNKTIEGDRMSKYWDAVEEDRRHARTQSMFWQVFVGMAVSMCACALGVSWSDSLPHFALLIVVIVHSALICAWIVLGSWIIARLTSIA